MQYPKLKAIAESKECFIYIDSSILVLWTVRQNRPPFSPVESLSYESWTVREHQNQKYAYGHGALILLILLVNSYR